MKFAKSNPTMFLNIFPRANTMLATIILGVIIITPIDTIAQFDWGGDGGSGTFQQDIAHNAIVTVGDIPSGIKDVRIELISNKDVDIQLYDKNTGQAIVQWPDGILNGPSKQSTNYHGVEITWSGYNGDGNGLGHEYIEIKGTTNRPFTMKAYGYAAGYATVNYSWEGNKQDSGSGTFQQNIAYRAIVTVGDIPSGITDVRIDLISDKDVDIQVYDKNTGQAIVQWPDGILNGSSKQSTNYHGVEITWSGYNGDGTGWGHEYIEIRGTTNRLLTMKAYGYASGYATVNYAWGKGTLPPIFSWSGQGRLDDLAAPVYGKSVKINPHLLSSTWMDNYRPKAQWGKKFHYFPKVNVVWFEFRGLASPFGSDEEVQTLLINDFKPNWVRVFTTTGGYGHYAVRDYIPIIEKQGKYVSDLGFLDGHFESGLTAFTCVVEVGLPEFTAEIRRQFAFTIPKDQSWWEKFHHWLINKTYGFFINFVKNVFGELRDVNGEIMDVFELKIVRNPAGDIFSARSMTFEETVRNLWDYLKFILDFFSNLNSPLQKMTLRPDITLDNSTLPQNFALHSNYPNPFNPTTNIEYLIPLTSHVKLKIYNAIGQEIRTLVNEEQQQGNYRVIWNARDNLGNPVSSGIYFYMLQAGEFTETRKATLLH